MSNIFRSGLFLAHKLSTSFQGRMQKSTGYEKSVRPTASLQGEPRALSHRRVAFHKYLSTHVIFADDGQEDIDDRPLEEGRPRGRAPGVTIQRVAQTTTLGKRARER